MDFFQNIFDMTGFGSLLSNPGYIIMILIGCILLFLGISDDDLKKNQLQLNQRDLQFFEFHQNLVYQFHQMAYGSHREYL